MIILNSNDNFFERLQKNHDKLTKKQTKLAFYLKINYKDAIFMSCTELGKETDMSEATVVRFANALGYEGYTEMIGHIHEYMKKEITVVEKLKNYDKVYDYSSIFTHIIENNLKLIRNIPKTISQKDVDMIVQDITNHSKIVVCALEDLGALADFLGYSLSRLGCSVEVLNSFSDHFKILNSIDKNTFVITFDFPRYIEKQIKFINYAKQKGAKIFSITDSTKAPIYELSDYTVIIPISSNYSFSIESFAALLTIFQILIFEYANQHHEIAENTIKAHYEFMKEFNS